MQNKTTQLQIIFALLGLMGECSAFAAAPDPAWDELRMRNLPPGRYAIASGTGFFVNGGYIITNEHVVQGCLSISIRGAVSPASAQLVAVDKAHDLALLYTAAQPQRVAYLRANSGVKPDDLVFIVGYPLQHAETGEYFFTQAKVIGFDGDFDQSEKIEITNAVNQGNSGGPLIDGGGNVIGVIVGTVTYAAYRTNATIKPETTTNGIAIGLVRLKQFLKEHGAYYNANSTYDIFTQYRPDRLARQYIVNIHCMKKGNHSISSQP